MYVTRSYYVVIWLCHSVFTKYSLVHDTNMRPSITNRYESTIYFFMVELIFNWNQQSCQETNYQSGWLSKILEVS